MFWRDQDISIKQLEDKIKEQEGNTDDMSVYGLSKAAVSSFAMICAKKYPHLTFSSTTPGYINTAIVRGWGATKEPKEGTVSIKHCLFNDLKGNGMFYGSDALRSPLHKYRNPGDPVYTE